MSAPGAARRGAASAGRPSAEDLPILATERLSVSYRTEGGDLPAVRDVSIDVAARQAVGLVGESGSGKSTLALGAIGYLPGNGRIVGGAARLHGVDLPGLRPRELRELWGSKIGLVSQDPRGALNPTLTIGRQLDEMGSLHLGLRKGATRRASLEMLARVDMPDPSTVVDRYPHQLSGGMLQRCSIAMALLTHPDLLILDEPTTSLDVTTQAMILDLLEDVGAEFGLAILYITHNLGVISRFCHRVVVMYAGEVLEQGDVKDLFSRPLHPYTANLLHCVPRLRKHPGQGPSGGPGGDRLATLPGDLPPLNALPPGCIFAPRCPLALPSCTVKRPSLMETEPGRSSACLRWTVMVGDEGQRAALAVTAAKPVPRAGSRPAPASPGAAPLLAVEDVVKEFPGPRRRTKVKAVRSVSLSLSREQTFGLVGESGSGKTTLARMVAGLTPPTSGAMMFDSEMLRPTVNKRRRRVLRRLQMVFQNPDGSLNPRHTVRQELVRPLIRLAGLDRRAAEDLAVELLRAVRLPAAYLDRYPGELSGGEKQRVAIARAFAAGPDLVLCDEPISSLDVSVQGALMNLLLDLQEEEHTSYLFISHDIAAVQHLSHRIGVMYRGELVEQGEASDVLSPPYHPYTEALLDAVPDPAAGPGGPVRLRGRGLAPAQEGDGAGGCRFSPRCPRYLGEVCSTQEPPWQSPGGEAPGSGPGGGPGGGHLSHAIRCHIPYERLGDVTASPEAPEPEVAGRPTTEEGDR